MIYAPDFGQNAGRKYYASSGYKQQCFVVEISRLFLVELHVYVFMNTLFLWRD